MHVGYLNISLAAFVERYPETETLVQAPGYSQNGVVWGFILPPHAYLRNRANSQLKFSKLFYIFLGKSGFFSYLLHHPFQFGP